jgi:YYY domain-containing protein
MLALLGWWFVLSVIGWLSWPLAALAFRAAPGRGYAYARSLGLLLVTYLFWISSSLTGVPNTRNILWLLVALLAMVNALLWVRHGAELRAFLREERRTILTAELLFAACFVLYAVQRSYHAAIIHTEQPMDFALLNGILASPRMPPQDPWLSGFTISYYYLGYLMAAVMVRLTGIASSVGYNLALAQTFALTAVAAYGLVHDLSRAHSRDPEVARKARGYGIVGAVALALASNLEGVLEGIKALGLRSEAFLQWFHVPGLSEAGSTGSWLPLGEWWWWRASRVITDGRLLGAANQVITEFPAFSFILGDLHPHVMALPFLILALAMAHELYLAAKEGIAAGWWRQWRFWAIPLAVGTLGFLNTWDLPLALTVCLLAVALGKSGGLAEERLFSWSTLAVLLWIAAWSVALYAPHYVVMRSQVQGVGVVYWAKTPLRHYLLCFGLWLLPIVADLFANHQEGWQSTLPARKWRGFWWAWALILLLPWLIILLVGGWGRLLLALTQILIAGPWLVLMQSILLGLLVVDLGAQASLGADQRDDSQVMVRLLVLLGIGLTYVSEFLYVRDLFDSRTNTVFKLYYQAWALLAIGATLALFRLRDSAGFAKLCFAATWVLLLGCLYYPVAAAYTRAQGYRGEATLDGVAFLRRESPSEYSAFEWLQARGGQGVIVEAPGEEYVAATSRMSAWTGMPTIIGWPGHEVQWRGNDQEVTWRIADVDRIYTLPDRQQVLALMRQYGATYLYVGPFERQRYQIDAGKLAWFASFLSTQYAEGNTRLFAVPRN